MTGFLAAAAAPASDFPACRAVALRFLLLFIHYGKIWVCQVLKTLGKGRKPLGKGFAECFSSGRSANRVGIGTTGKELFAEFFSSGRSAKPLPCVIIKRAAKKSKRTLPTRKRWCHVTGVFAECLSRQPSAKIVPLPSAMWYNPR